MTTYPKRLIEVDLPIARISAHARREKSIRHGHISTLHIWWARRPLAACRAVICAALWPDPADPLCPQAFRDKAVAIITAFARRFYPEKITEEQHTLWKTASEESQAKWKVLAEGKQPLDPKKENHLNTLRHLLLDFIADFANWDNSTVPAYLETSRALTQAAHEALGGEPGTRPLVVDPFAGGGSIPLEALRVGADAFASDLNPVAVLLNKVVLEYIPKYRQKLADEVRKWGQWIKEQAEKELAAFYPKDPDGATPIAYLWARTIRCEGPGCGAEVPLMRSLWLAKKRSKSVALRIVPKPKAKRVDFEIIHEAKANDVGGGTVRRGSATCPCCGFTTPVKSVREQLKKRHGGAADSLLFCVVTTQQHVSGRNYRLPNQRDSSAVTNAAKELEHRKKVHKDQLSLVPDEPIDVRGIRHTWGMIYGISDWGSCFSPRQLLILTTLVKKVAESEKLYTANDMMLKVATKTCLGFVIDRAADGNSSLTRWQATGEKISNTFGRQALPMVWDYCEANPFCDATRSLNSMVDWVAKVAEQEVRQSEHSTSSLITATHHSLPDDTVNALITDPPYYDSVPYAYLSDFFYVWLRRVLKATHITLFSESHVPKDQEIVVDRQHILSHSTHDVAFYEQELKKAFAEGCRILRHDGICVIVFASKSTSSWEAILQAVVLAGWTITGSWPIDTEMETRVAAQGQARLASSVHLVCRPRTTDEIGDWRDVLGELPKRMHEWMPRLTSEGVVGADAIFACLGPALEIFSRYSRVEKANGDQVLLKEYLEQVWAAISKEALSTIFRDANAAGLEPDARLTAMWLWTLAGPATVNAENTEEAEESEEEEEEKPAKGKMSSAGFTLEYDTARKIAQGLGINLEQLTTLVEVKGDKARMLPVAERAQALFGKKATLGEAATGRKKKSKQGTIFDLLGEGEGTENSGMAVLGHPDVGNTVLDRVHQAMLLFAAGRGEMLKRFLVEDGVGKDARFWKLADNLNKLYPPGIDERRWIEGVLARKKGLGL